MSLFTYMCTSWDLHMRTCVSVYMYMCPWYRYIPIGWWRPIAYVSFIDHFPQKSPMISGSFAKNDLQPKASYGSLPPCTYMCVGLSVADVRACMCVCVRVCVCTYLLYIYMCMHIMHLCEWLYIQERDRQVNSQEKHTHTLSLSFSLLFSLCLSPKRRERQVRH